MSAAADAPTGSTGAVDTQGAGPTTEHGTGEATSRGYLERARTDADFAVNELTKHQSRADSLAAEKRKLEESVGADLMPYLEQYGGSKLAASLKTLEAMTTNPEMMEAIQNFQAYGSPRLETPDSSTSDSTGTGDEYKTPEELKIESLEAELARTRGEVGQIRSQTSRAALMDHLDRFFTEFVVEDDQKRKVIDGAGKVIEAWKAGGEAGLAALNNLSKPEFYETTLRGILSGQLDLEEQREALNRAAARRKSGLGGLATDSPSSTASSGTEAPPEFSSTTQALEWARAHADQLGDRY